MTIEHEGGISWSFSQRFWNLWPKPDSAPKFQNKNRPSFGTRKFALRKRPVQYEAVTTSYPDICGFHGCTYIIYYLPNKSVKNVIQTISSESSIFRAVPLGVSLQDGIRHRSVMSSLGVDTKSRPKLLCLLQGWVVVPSIFFFEGRGREGNQSSRR